MKSTLVLYKVNTLWSDSENWTYHSVHFINLNILLLKLLNQSAGIIKYIIFFTLVFIYLQEEFNFVMF